MKYEKPNLEEMEIILEGSFLQGSTGTPMGGEFGGDEFP